MKIYLRILKLMLHFLLTYQDAADKKCDILIYILLYSGFGRQICITEYSEGLDVSLSVHLTQPYNEPRKIDNPWVRPKSLPAT